MFKNKIKKLSVLFLSAAVILGSYTFGQLNPINESYAVTYGSDFGNLTTVNQSITKTSGQYTFTSSINRAIYKVECWGEKGSKGASSLSGTGGVGGYAQGQIVLNAGQEIYINLDYGGGTGSYAGGGMTYVCSGSSALNTTNVIMVAAGGGGGGYEGRCNVLSPYHCSGVAGGNGGTGGSYYQVKTTSGTTQAYGSKSNGTAGTSHTKGSYTDPGGAAGTGGTTLLGVVNNTGGGAGAGYYGGTAGAPGRTSSLVTPYGLGGSGGGGGGTGYIDANKFSSYNYTDSSITSAQVKITYIGIAPNYLNAVTMPLVYVPYGTSLDEVKGQLGTTKEFTGTYNNEALAITWTCATYQANKAGAYVFSGMLDSLPDNTIYNGTLPITANVVVAALATAPNIPTVTVCQNIGFDVVKAGFDDIPNGTLSKGITVINTSTSDNYIRLQGNLPTTGVFNVTLGSYLFIINVIPEPTSSTVTVIFN